MTFRYFSSSILVNTAGTDAITVNAGDSIIVEAGVTVGASGFNAGTNYTYGIFGVTSSGLVDVQVYGTVFGTHGGIFLGLTNLPQAVFVGATGRVLSEEVALTLGGGTSLSLQNAGIIRSTYDAVVLHGINVDVLNTGSIASTFSDGIIVERGTVNLVNTGTIWAPVGAHAFQDQSTYNTTIWNSGLIVGNVQLGGGNDLYQGGGQVVDGRIAGGQGNDTIIGSAGNDIILDDSGANWLAGGDGTDDIWFGVLSGPLAVSHLFGGVIGGADTSANDTLDFWIMAGVGVNVFLSAGAGIGQVTRVGDNALAAYINGFENVTGSIFADAIIGSSGANVIEGREGGDWMVGNGGADRFVFRAVNNAVAGDQIRDFRRSEGDRIDLSGIDASLLTDGTNEAFIFRTTRTSNAAGEAVVTNFGNSARVDLYIDANNTVDGTFIVVYGEAGVTNLQASDFIL